MSLLTSYASSTPLARTPVGRSEYSSSILSSCSCGKSLASCSDGRCSSMTGGGGLPSPAPPPDKFNFSEQVGIVNSASSLVDDHQTTAAGQGGATVWPQVLSGRGCGGVVSRKKCSSPDQRIPTKAAAAAAAAAACLPSLSRSGSSAIARAKECFTNDSSGPSYTKCCCCPRDLSGRNSEGGPDRVIDKAAAEIIAIARRLTEREIGGHALAELTTPTGNDQRGFSVRELMHEEVRRLEDKLHRAECLEKDVEKGLQNDRTLLERIEETLVSLGREESRLLWKAEELGRRCETMDIIHNSRGQGGGCVARLKQEAERLRRLIEELEAQEGCGGAAAISPRTRANPLVHLKAALDSEKCEVLDILERLRGEKGNQLNRAKELRTQIFDDRRKLDLMLEKHIHLVQEINRLKTSAARNISSSDAA